jgi:hypothetical protein
MTLVFPLLLGGLALAGLPVLLHFLIRQKPKTLLFPAFRFLMQKQRSNTRNLRLRHLLLLALRVALIVLLCFALSRPRLFYDSVGLGHLNAEKPLAMVLVFDTSPSMDYKHGETSRLDLAKKRALELLEPLSPDCRVLILETDTDQNAQAEFLPSLDKARQRIQSLAIRPESIAVNRVVEEAMRRFERWDEPLAYQIPKFVCVFSDRTKASWDSSASVKQHDEVKVLYFDVGIDEPADLAITHVEFTAHQQSFIVGDTIELHAVVKATGADVENELIVRLDGKEKALPFAIKKDQQDTIPFSINTSEWKLGVGYHALEIRLKQDKDALAFNNRRFVSLQIRKMPRVLLLTDNPDKVTRFTGLLRANLVDVDTKRPQDKASLGDYEAIFLVSVAAPEEKVWRDLTAFVEQGRGVAVIPGGEMQIKAYDTDAARKLLPTRIRTKVEAKDGAAWDLAVNHLQHPFMRPIQGWTDQFLRQPRFAYQYWQVEKFKEAIDVEVVVEYVGGDPAIVERQLPKSNGKVLLLTTPMDERTPAWNNYSDNAVSPLFDLTLLWLCTRHLVAESERVPLNHTFGQAMPSVQMDVSLPKTVLAGAELNEEIRFDEKKTWRAERLPREGHYTVTGSNPDTQRSRVLTKFSVNIASEESDLTRLPREQIASAFGPDVLVPQDQHTPMLDTLASHWDEPMELFPILMIVLLLLFALENLIANKFYRQEPAAS